MSDLEPLWSYREAAAHSGVAESTLRAYRVAGRLPEPDAVIAGSPRWRADRWRAWQAGRVGRGGWSR